jgi:outer membrane protein OmpA-like peptidoglycan-associated protein
MEEAMKKILATVLAAAFIAGCASMGQKEQTGTAVGAGTGAVLGGVVGAATGSHNQREKAVVGAAIGALAGGVIGNRVGAYMDNQEQALRSAMSSTIAANDAAIQRNSEQVLTATFKSDFFFDTDSAILKPGAQPELERVANVLNQYPQTRIRIEGYTDPTGSEDYNLKLSQRRADAVRNALIQRGIDPARLNAIGMGECCPISSDNAANRRVSLVLTAAA